MIEINTQVKILTIKQNKLLKLTLVVYLDWVLFFFLIFLSFLKCISRATTVSLHLHSLVAGTLPHYHRLLSATLTNCGEIGGT